MRYAVEVSWSEKDAAWIASVPDLPGCLANGPTREAAVAAAAEAAELWLEVAREEGRPIPEPSQITPLAQRYTVSYEQDENGWWVATVRGIPGVSTQARSIEEAKARVAEALAAALGEGVGFEIMHDIEAT